MDRSVNQFRESLNHSCDPQNYRKQFIFPTTETREISILEAKSVLPPTFNFPDTSDSKKTNQSMLDHRFPNSNIKQLLFNQVVKVKHLTKSVSRRNNGVNKFNPTNK